MCGNPGVRNMGEGAARKAGYKPWGRGHGIGYGLTAILILTALEMNWAAGDAEMRIAVGVDAAEPVRFAADELARYVNEATSISPEVSPDAALTGRHALGLVRSGAPLAESVREPVASHEEAYRIYSTGDGGRMFSGRSPRALLYAVYDFLEEELGYRWYFPYPEDSVTPHLMPDAWEAVLAQTVDREESPAFAFREREFRDVSPMNDQTDARIVQQIDWWAKLRMNRFLLNFGYARDAALWKRWKEVLIPEIKKRGLLVGLGEHGSYPLFLPPARYAREHPEWYCEIGGKRIPDMRIPGGAGTQFCTSNAEAVAEYLANFAAFVRDNPEIDFYYPAPNDVSSWCECEKCRGMSIADRYLRLDNQVAEMLARVKPGTRVMHLAYSNHRLPPEETLPDPMIDVDVACWGRDFAYPLSDPRTMPDDAEYLDVFRRWATICGQVTGDVKPRFVYHCKLMRHYWLGLHLLPLSVIDEDFACAQELWLDGFDFPLGFLGIWTKALNAYVVAKKCWNPAPAVAVWTDRFFTDYYGEKAANARHIYRLVDEAFSDRRYGVSLNLVWHPERIAVRDTPLEGLGKNARNAVGKLDEAIGIADANKNDPCAVRFRKLHAVLNRARDEQRVLLALDALSQAHQDIQKAETGEAREQTRQQALRAWTDTKTANDALASRYSLDDDMAGLYWAGASHKEVERALEQWRDAIKGLVWNSVGTWETGDFGAINVPIQKRFDVTDPIRGRAPCHFEIKFKYSSGEIGVTTRSVSLWEVQATGEETCLSEDKHGGFAGYVHENATYRLDARPLSAPDGRYDLRIDLQPTASSGTVAQRGCNGEILLGLPGTE